MATGLKSSPAEKRISNFLVKSGKLDAEKARSIEQTAEADGIPLIEALHRKGVLHEEEVAKTVAAGLRIPLLNLPTVPFGDNVAQLLEEALANKYDLVPIRSEKDTIVIAMANPFDQEIIKDIEFRTGKRVRPAIAPRSQILEAIAHVYKFDNSLRSLLNDVPDDEDISLIKQQQQEEQEDPAAALSREAEQAPIVKMVNLILVEALKTKASDIHIQPGPNVVMVRYRVHGVLEDALEIPKWVQNPVVARLKVMAKLDITERRVPQDGRLHIRFNENLVDLRVNTLPTSYGEKIVMRVLDPATALKNLDTIGLSESDIFKLRKAIKRPEGMVLVTGPTGSGKTTTLYAIIQEIFTPERNIVTIENPIEYEMNRVSQVEVNERQGLTFANVLRSVLRQDPDVILVGEIRDRETADVAMRAAQTGHLVLSTLHTNDTAATITRLTDLGIEPFMIASSLIAVVAQRLVRTVCAACAEPYEIPEERAKALGITIRDYVRRGRGCPHCRGGYDGRIGCYEVLEVSNEVKEAIENRKPESAIRKIGRDQGMTSLRHDAVSKVESGKTTPDEVDRVIQFDDRTDKGSAVDEILEGARDVAAGDGAAGGAAPTPHRPAPSPLAGPAEGSIQKPRVLVVDDTDVLRKIVRKTLERSDLGIEVDEAANGFEALEKIAQNRPHAIILDIMMPGMDGFEVCKSLRSNIKTALIPIIMLTAKEDSESKVQGFLAGTDDYLVKPFNRDELLARIQRLMQRTYGLESTTAATPAVDEAPAPS